MRTDGPTETNVENLWFGFVTITVQQWSRGQQLCQFAFFIFFFNLLSLSVMEMLLLSREREKGGGGGGCREREMVGGGGTIYLTIHCHHQNYFCIKVGSRGSHFNVSLIVRGKVHRPYP